MDWAFILASGTRHPGEMGMAEVKAVLSALATEDQVAAGTQNQALSALLFPYRRVLLIELPCHVAMTQIYTHVLNRGGRGVISPLDR